MGSDRLSICEREYAYLKEQFTAHENGLQLTSNLLARVESNIWLTSPDRDEIECVLREKDNKLIILKKKMDTLTVTYNSSFSAEP